MWLLEVQAHVQTQISAAVDSHKKNHHQVLLIPSSSFLYKCDQADAF